MAVDDAALGQVVRANRDSDAISEDDTDAVPPQLAGEVGVHFCGRLGQHKEVSAWKHFLDGAFELDQVVTRHASPSGAPWVSVIEGRVTFRRFAEQRGRIGCPIGQTVCD